MEVQIWTIEQNDDGETDWEGFHQGRIEAVNEATRTPTSVEVLVDFGEDEDGHSDPPERIVLRDEHHDRGQFTTFQLQLLRRAPNVNVWRFEWEEEAAALGAEFTADWEELQQLRMQSAAAQAAGADLPLRGRIRLTLLHNRFANMGWGVHPVLADSVGTAQSGRSLSTSSSVVNVNTEGNQVQSEPFVDDVIQYEDDKDEEMPNAEGGGRRSRRGRARTSRKHGGGRARSTSPTQAKKRIPVRKAASPTRKASLVRKARSASPKRKAAAKKPAATKSPRKPRSASPKPKPRKARSASPKPRKARVASPAARRTKPTRKA